VVNRSAEGLEERLAELGAFIRAQREFTKLSVRRLSELAGVSNPYLSQIERGLRRPSAEVLQQIARGLQISAETLYERAGLLERGGTAPAAAAGTARAAIAEDTALTPEQRQVLLRVYDSFVAEAPESRSEQAG
jgi:transcriptional regulator with XRE-family HTH domain